MVEHAESGVLEGALGGYVNVAAAAADAAGFRRRLDQSAADVDLDVTAVEELRRAEPTAPWAGGGDALSELVAEAEATGEVAWATVHVYDHDE